MDRNEATLLFEDLLNNGLNLKECRGRLLARLRLRPWLRTETVKMLCLDTTLSCVCRGESQGGQNFA